MNIMLFPFPVSKILPGKQQSWGLAPSFPGISEKKRESTWNMPWNTHKHWAFPFPGISPPIGGG